MNNQNEKTLTIGERFGNPHNPVLRWCNGVYSSLHIDSALVPLSDEESDICEFFSVDDFCEFAGDSASPDMQLTDSEWSDLLRSFVADSSDGSLIDICF